MYFAPSNARLGSTLKARQAFFQKIYGMAQCRENVLTLPPMNRLLRPQYGDPFAAREVLSCRNIARRLCSHVISNFSILSGAHPKACATVFAGYRFFHLSAAAHHRHSAPRIIRFDQW